MKQTSLREQFLQCMEKKAEKLRMEKAPPVEEVKNTEKPRRGRRKKILDDD